MPFSVFLYTSLAIFFLGLIYRVSTWFSRKIGFSARNIKISERVSSAARGIVGVVFSSKILILVKVLMLDVVLQIRILKEDFLRWLMHMLIYGGFILLLLMHALDKMITASLFTDYYSTINPFFFLRDFFGTMVIVGLFIAVYRRFILKMPRLKTNAMDYYAIIILAVIMISGLLLEGVKITSHTVFMRMVEDYAGLDDEEEIESLESVWVKEFGLVSPNVKGPFGKEVLAAGLEIHEANCIDCHSSSKWAFAGYSVSRALKPIALPLDRAGGTDFLWYVHILGCFIGLAYLPFSKMFHIIAIPISLLANAAMEKEKSDPANIATLQALELDACTHCSTCNLRCSSATAFDAIGNPYILPSEKMTFLKTLAAGKEVGRDELKAIREGIYLCTNCDRCTVTCPAGINLKQLWFDVREDLVQKGYPEPLVLSPYSFFRGLNRRNLPADNYIKPLEAAHQAVSRAFETTLKQQEPIFLTDRSADPWTDLPNAHTYAYCFGCQNCTNVCPVVDSYDNPEETLGLLPHQIMCCLGMGLVEMASGPRMLWDCVTCYQCQEHCPQKVNITDLFFQLKILAVKKMKHDRVSTC
ncbi:MAG: 4Fe-4S dicluster domain-containing protein [Deltaproteobacteria bacterium]|nr:4Fe-4S dicluster domain-containing protein [Deltaproteobacteria bacterium]